MMLPFMSAVALAGCTATDGDTIACGPLRVRLLGIDAPELDGHCRRGRVCVKGDGRASRRSLEAGLRRGRIVVRLFGRDAYGRALGHVWAGGANLSCWQLARGAAIYKPGWDNGRRTRAACPALTRG
jgi:micrococcal nuclease